MQHRHNCSRLNPGNTHGMGCKGKADDPYLTLGIYQLSDQALDNITLTLNSNHLSRLAQVENDNINCDKKCILFGFREFLVGNCWIFRPAYLSCLTCRLRLYQGFQPPYLMTGCGICPTPSDIDIMVEQAASMLHVGTAL